MTQDGSCSDTEELVDETHNSDGEENGTPDECEDDDMVSLCVGARECVREADVDVGCVWMCESMCA